jgi:PAS domain S-box-containing protein
MKLGVMDYMAKGPASAYALSRTVASAIRGFRLRSEVARQRIALERRNLELEAVRAELFAEKERYRILAEAIPQLVWISDSSGCIDYGNQRLWEFTGKADSAQCALESLVHADDATELRSTWDEAVRSGCAFESELRLRRAQDRTWRRHLMRTAPIPSAAGGSVRWLGTFTDIEDQKRAEEDVRRREKLDSIGLLAGGIAHDFNNLLTAILGGASLALASLETGHPAFSMIELVMSSSERAAELTGQLLAYAGTARGLPGPADISSIVADACRLAQASMPANVHLVIETAADIPPVIETNASDVRQMIVNLAINAAEAAGADDGLVTVKTTVRRVDRSEAESGVPGYRLPAGMCLSIEVSDSGPGIDGPAQTRIFDPFFTTKFMGRGLGLAVVQGIARSLCAGVRVRSAPGTGSTFEVLLPLGESRDASV